MRWIVGDIHGMARPLDALVAAVRARDAAARFYFVGDFVNRGPDSRSVLEMLIAMQRDGHAHFVRGNHDDILDQVINGLSYTGKVGEIDRLAAFQWFMQHGLDTTFISYGVDLAELHHLERRITPMGLERLIAAVPEEHRQFLRNLPPVIEEPGLFIVHAKWNPDDGSEPRDFAHRLAAHAPARHELLWGRFSDTDIARPKRWNRTGYFGHTPVAVYGKAGKRGEHVPVLGPQIVLLDTGAALSAAGRLTAYCAETGSYVQADRAGTIT